MTGISSIGLHLPRLRLARASMAVAMDWLSPRSETRGARTLAFWDEDPITMGVAAARACLSAAGDDPRGRIAGLRFATTSPVFAEPQNASLVHAALRLDPQAVAEDSGGTLRCGLIGLHMALESQRPTLVVAADCPISPAGSSSEARFGDGAAAALVGPDPGLLTYLGGAGVTAPFVERYRAASREMTTDWEERWVREEGFLALVPRAIATALAHARLKGEEIHHFILPSIIPGCAKAVAQAAGLSRARIASNLDIECGDTGAAHALVMLARAMENMKPGERVLVAQFGQGATALVLEATAALDAFSPGATAQIETGIAETNYLKLPIFRGLLPWERGLRGRVPVNEALTTAYRNADALLGFVGGRSPATGEVQFPPSRLPASQAGFHTQAQMQDHAQEPWPLADLGGTVATATADRLAFSRHPPNCYGLVDIAGGGRLMMEFTDPDAPRIAPGDRVRFVFRIKDMDERTGYRRYFWKAVAQAPSSRSAQPAEQQKGT